jgi:uracil-DNA glycosylase family 4
MLSRTETLALLQFYVALGLDEATEAAPIDRRRLDAPAPAAPAQEAHETRAPSRAATPREPAPATASRPAPRAFDPQQAVEAAENAAAACDDLVALEAAVRAFDGCALKATAMNTVFADGSPDAEVMFLGEAPGADEDRLGKPFVGASGKLLDRMLEAIGLGREGVYISNVVFWRPPGNRTPTPVELAVCLPFVRRHIALKRPKLVILAGATAAQTVLGSELTIGRLRHKWHDLAVDGAGETAPAIATYHPSFLLRTPEKKRDAWMDFLRLRMKLRELSILT